MQLLEDDIIQRDAIKYSDDNILEKPKRRCQELIDRHPGQLQLFINYIQKQIEENDVLENKIIGTTLMIGRK